MSQASRAGMESATARLGRLLAMVPWLLNRQGVDIGEAAARFGVSTAQMERDLQLLFVCGTPGHLPDDLIEADWEGGKVYLANADTIARPLRLGVDEALALIVGLRALAAVPDLAEHDAVARALAKLEDATGTEAVTDASSRIQLAIDGSVGPTGTDAFRLAQQALVAHRRLHLRYLVSSRDESTERDVDPMRIVNQEGHWYLEAWCHRAGDVRLFRFSQVESLTVLEVDGTPPPQARPRDLSAGLYRPAAGDLVVRLRLAPEAGWVSDYYPTEDVRREADGSQVVTLRTPDPGWVRRLVWRLGGEATVLEPAALVAEVRTGAQAALGRYASADSPPPGRDG